MSFTGTPPRPPSSPHLPPQRCRVASTLFQPAFNVNSYEGPVPVQRTPPSCLKDLPVTLRLGTPPPVPTSDTTTTPAPQRGPAPGPGDCFGLVSYHSPRARPTPSSPYTFGTDPLPTPQTGGVPLDRPVLPIRGRRHERLVTCPSSGRPDPPVDQGAPVPTSSLHESYTHLLRCLGLVPTPSGVRSQSDESDP